MRSTALDLAMYKLFYWGGLALIIMGAAKWQEHPKKSVLMVVDGLVLSAAFGPLRPGTEE